MYLIKPYDTDNKSEAEDQSPKDQIVELRSTHIRQSFLIALLTNLVALVFVSDNIYLKFSATYFQYIPLQLSASDSAHLVIHMTIVYTLDRAMPFLISIRIRPQTIIMCHILILIMSLVVMFFGQTN